MKLENLVASLELCRKIPAGEFAGSAMVYLAMDGFITVCKRGDYERWMEKYTYPSPTVEEIMRQLPTGTTLHFDFTLSRWLVTPPNGTTHGEDEKAADAALRMLIKLKGW